MKIHIFERESYDCEVINQVITDSVASGWTLLGPVQICPKQGHGGLYVYLATMVHTDPAAERPSGLETAAMQVCRERSFAVWGLSQHEFVLISALPKDLTPDKLAALRDFMGKL